MGEIISPFEVLKVDKISDDVYTLGPNVLLKFNVSLSRNSNGKRYHFHKEFEYPSPLDGYPTLVTIKRSFDYYLSIESIQKDENGNKLFIRIGVQEYMIFKKGLEEAISWFTDSKYKNLFATNRGKLVMTSPIPEFKISNLPMDKYIEFIPTIIDRGAANADKFPGIRMFLGSDSVFVDLSVDRLMGLYYIVSTFNMYQSACDLINYLERPDFGTNRFVMEQTYRSSYSRDTQESHKTSGIEGRFVTPKNDISKLEG